MNTLADTSAFIEQFIPGTLVSPEAFAKIKKLGQHLPAALTENFLLECRLQENATQVDFIFWVEKDRAKILTHLNNGTSFSPAMAAKSEWRRLSDFSKSWQEPGALLNKNVDKIYLECDIIGRAGNLPVPAIGLELNKNFIAFQMAHPQQAQKSLLRLTKKFLQPFRTSNLPQQVQENLLQCFQLMPDDAHAAFIAFFPQRKMECVRLCIRALSEPALIEYLQKTGWPGSFSNLKKILSLLAPDRNSEEHLSSTLMLDIDIWERTLPRISIEYLYNNGKNQFNKPVSSGKWLNHLITLGLATQTKAEALKNWRGYSIEQFPHLIWRSVFVRFVSPIKIVISPDGIEAKAYLNFNYTMLAKN